MEFYFASGNASYVSPGTQKLPRVRGGGCAISSVQAFVYAASLLAAACGSSSPVTPTPTTVQANFKADTTNGLKASFTNTSTLAVGNALWNFGDGTNPVSDGSPTVVHIFPDAATYSVSLTVTDGTGKTDVKTAPVRVDRKGVTIFQGTFHIDPHTNSASGGFCAPAGTHAGTFRFTGTIAPAGVPTVVMSFSQKDYMFMTNSAYCSANGTCNSTVMKPAIFTSGTTAVGSWPGITPDGGNYCISGMTFGDVQQAVTGVYEIVWDYD